MTVRSVQVATTDQIAASFGDRHAVLLSVSVPFERSPSRDDPSEIRRAAVERNAAYLRSAQFPRIRSAVLSIARACLMRRVRVVFGAHPSVSPMVLDMARDVATMRAGMPPGAGGIFSAASDPDVLIFQSQYFAGELPNSTLELASWEAGLLVLTPAMSGRTSAESRRLSVNLMRKLMVMVPGLRGAVFIGGMEGVEEEAHMFAELAPGKPMYAIASTGAAALKLWEADSSKYSGTLDSPQALYESTCYSGIAADILADMDVSGDQRES